MTTEEVVQKVEKLLRDGFEGSDTEENVSVGRVSDENAVGLDIGDKTWFIEIQEG